MEYEPSKGTVSPGSTSKHVRINIEVSYKEAEPLSWGSRGSSSSSDSSSLDFNFGERDVLSYSHVKSEQTDLGLENGISSLKVSPPVQVMGKPSGYDPNRIPAFVFSSKPATPMEWSVASNESLFSIHMGNNSFSKDLPILIAKSQELGKFDEATNFSSSLPPVTEAAYTESDTVHTRKASGGKEESTEVSMVDSIRNAEDQRKQNMPPSVEGRESVSPFHSDGLGSEDQRNNFVKVEADSERQKSQPQTPRANPNAACCNWFSCFSCFSRFSCHPICC